MKESLTDKKKIPSKFSSEKKAKKKRYKESIVTSTSKADSTTKDDISKVCEKSQLKTEILI